MPRLDFLNSEWRVYEPLCIVTITLFALSEMGYGVEDLVYCFKLTALGFSFQEDYQCSVG